MSAQIYDSGIVYPIVAERSLLRKKPGTLGGYVIEPACAMQTYSLARQFMSLFCKDVMASPETTTEQEKLVGELRLRGGLQSSTWGNNMINLPEDEITQGEEKHHNESNKGPQRVFFFQEMIKGYKSLLLPETTNYHISNSSSNPEKLLHAFQHWVYIKTSGQMTLTNFKGNPPLITKPIVIDLNPESYWFNMQDTKTMMQGFFKKHTCTQVCSKVLNLPPFIVIPWSPNSTKVPEEKKEKVQVINPNSAKPQGDLGAAAKKYRYKGAATNLYPYKGVAAKLYPYKGTAWHMPYKSISNGAAIARPGASFGGLQGVVVLQRSRDRSCQQWRGWTNPAFGCYLWQLCPPEIHPRPSINSP
ncbi:hypothetical protein PCASD_07412 [Puccinia coronata f. sp. avenae]|uniref:Alpha-type protein kinase domain-containing protein n=1 Tax=Puccinia coronata f. sp. avenae TaxID=200324 RepID=A0A2N5S7A9_9BASI|nr:hypothetical protein PCASD_24695 [Puccinia coronata f. sp. avenae]PLW46585.1 hypothetical protein PCASD_07412 [Puccinia coronata f. sp. avenae]